MDIRTKDGITLRGIPDGTPEAEIKARVEQIRQQRRGWEPARQDSIAERIGMGALEAGLGVAQLASRPVGLFYGRSPEAVDSAVADLNARQEEGAPEGFDAARLVGNVLPLAPASFARYPAAVANFVTAGRPMAQAAKGGAIAGAGGGAVMPTSGEDFAQNKAVQVAGGAVGGALLGPLASKGGQVIWRGVNAARSALGRQNQNVSFHLDQILQMQGINPQAIGRDLRRELEAQVARALETGGTVNPQHLANLTTLESVGVRQPTRGMVSQDPVQFGEELSLRETSRELAARFQDARNQLGGRLQSLQGGTPTTTPGAGRAALSVLKNADEAARLETSQLYRAAEQAHGNTVFIKSREPHERAVAELKQRRAWQDLDPAAKSVLDDLQTGKLTVRQAVEDIESLNKRLVPGDPKSVGIGIVKRHIDDAIDEAATDAGEGFKLARQRHRARKLEQEQLPALKAVSEARTPDELARLSDDFMGRHVYGGSVSDVRRMMDFLRQRDPQAANAIRGRIVADLHEAATKGGEQGKFLQNQFNTKLRELEDSELFSVIFNAQEQQTLRSIGRAAQLVEGPSQVSRTGLGGMARAINMLGDFAAKYGGNWLGAPIRVGTNRLSNTIRTQNALSAPAVATAGNIVPRYRNALAIGAGAGIVPAIDD